MRSEKSPNSRIGADLRGGKQNEKEKVKTSGKEASNLVL